MNILVISDLYPTATIKSGYFVYNQVKELSKHSNVSVVIPRELPMTYRNLSTLEGIHNEIDCLSRLKKEPTSISYEAGEIRPFLKLPGKQLCFAQSKLFVMQNGKNIARIVNRFRPNIVCAHQIIPSGGIAYYIKKKYGIPYIVYEHGADIISNSAGQGFALRNRFNFELSRKVLDSASHVLTNSERMKNELLRLFSNISVSINHLGVNFEKHKDFKERDKARKERSTIVSLCYLDESKRIQDNIMAVRELLNRGYDISYDIYGNGAYETKLKQLVDVNHLTAHVSFKGFLRNEDVIDTLSKYDLFSLPSWEEAFGIVYLEALAAGIPAIGTRDEGPEEINRYGDIIYTVPRSNIRALAGTIEGLICDYNSSKQRVVLGQRMLLEEFNWSKNVESLLKTIDSIGISS
jgi:teichuronic acid biosynthesis glycosyltransferase TuaC